jgi:hypothetical protein
MVDPCFCAEYIYGKGLEYRGTTRGLLLISRDDDDGDGDDLSLE